MSLKDIKRKLNKAIKNPYIILDRAIIKIPLLGHHLRDETCLNILYRSRMGQRLNLENPQTFTEKIQWIKLNYRRPEYCNMVDKYEAKKYVADKVGYEYVIPTLGVWNMFDDIDFDDLPEQFVLKCTHDCGGIVICKDKKQFNIKKARKKINKSLKRNFYWLAREWQYKSIQPRIIAEKYIEDNSGNLYDYKIHCFGGEPKFIQCIGDRNLLTHTGYQDNFDLNWKKLDWIFEDYPHFPYMVPKPKNLEKMISIAKKLSEKIPYVRVDLYNINNSIYFGEMTFTPATGIYEYKGSWSSDMDLQLGNLINLPEISI